MTARADRGGASALDGRVERSGADTPPERRKAVRSRRAFSGVAPPKRPLPLPGVRSTPSRRFSRPAQPFARTVSKPRRTRVCRTQARRPEPPGAARWRARPWAPYACPPGGEQALDRRHSRDGDDVARRRVQQSVDPSGTGLGNVALHKSGAVDEVGSHSAALVDQRLRHRRDTGQPRYCDPFRRDTEAPRLRKQRGVVLIPQLNDQCVANLARSQRPVCSSPAWTGFHLRPYPPTSALARSTDTPRERNQGKRSSPTAELHTATQSSRL